MSSDDDASSIGLDLLPELIFVIPDIGVKKAMILSEHCVQMD